MQRCPAFILPALLWLPLGLALVTVGRGFSLALSGWPLWLELVFIAPLGVPLAWACRALWRGGHVVSASVAAVVLAPATVLGVLMGGLFGPFGVVVYALFFSLPAWGVYGFFRYCEKNRPT